MTRSRRFAQDINTCDAAVVAAASQVVAVNGMAEAGPYVTPQPAREPLVAIVRLEMGLD